MSRKNRVPLADGVARAAEAAPAARRFVSAIDMLVGIGWLELQAVERWRRRQIGCREDVVCANLPLHLGSHEAFPLLADRAGIDRKLPYTAPPETALQPKRKSCVSIGPLIAARCQVLSSLLKPCGKVVALGPSERVGLRRRGSEAGDR